MRIAALNDIHGNLPALDAVLEALESEGVEKIVVGGDVLPGPMPGDCLDRLNSLDLPVAYLFGNGETETLVVERGEELVRVPKQFHPIMEWVHEQLTAEQLAHIARWPATVRDSVPELGEVLFCHATPRDDNEIFTRLTDAARLQPIFDAAEASVVVCGHTHMQFDRQVGRTRVVNAGSVGMPFGEPGAYWALLSAAGVELRHTPYDYAGAEQQIAETRYPMSFAVSEPPTEAAMLATFEAAAQR